MMVSILVDFQRKDKKKQELDNLLKPKVTESHSNLSFGTINFLPFVKENFQLAEAP